MRSQLSSAFSMKGTARKQDLRHKASYRAPQTAADSDSKLKRGCLLPTSGPARQNIAGAGKTSTFTAPKPLPSVSGA